MLKAGTAARRRSLAWDEPPTPEVVREQIAVLLDGIGGRLQTVNPHWIGHVKIMVSSDGEATYGSLTAATDRPQWAGALQTTTARAEMTIYAAIYNFTDAQVASAVDETLGANGLTS